MNAHEFIRSVKVKEILRFKTSPGPVAVRTTRPATRDPIHCCLHPHLFRKSSPVIPHNPYPSYLTILNAMPGLSKHLFLNTLTCPTLGWRLYRGTIREQLTPDVLFRMEQGKKIGTLARQLHPDGVFVYASDNKTAASLTRELMEDPLISVIFEGTFISGNYVAKADILIRNGDSWDLVEVKSGVQQKQDYIEDMAYTTLIAKNSGFVPARIRLQLISREYRLGMPLPQLFETVDCTDDVQNCAGQFEPFRDSVDTTLHSPEEPAPALTMHCKKCDHFDTCTGSEGT